MPALLLQQPSYGSLRQFLDHHFDSIHWPERYKLALDMAQGLRFLTTQGIPCTLHSGSVLVDAEGVAVLTGFGRERGMIASAPCQMTAQPSNAALVVYTAPEKLAAIAAATAAAGAPTSNVAYSPDWEVFSLGILLWELSSGRLPFEEIIARAEAGPRLNKNIEQLSSAIQKGLREETVPGTPEIYEQLFKMCWDSEAESRPPLEVVEETLQMLVVVEPMDMLMLPDDEMNMHVSSVLSDSVDNESVSSHNTPTRSNSVRSLSPLPGYQPRQRPTTLHEAISVSNADMTEWYILSGHDLNGYAIVPTFSLECEITPILTCLGHFLPSSLPIFKELMEQDVDLSLLCRRSNQNGLHVLVDRYIPFKNENGSAHLMEAMDILLKHVSPVEMDINGLDVQGHTPLHLLMRNPRISSEDVAEILKKMVPKGADTTRAAPRDGNVLALAAKYLHFEATKHILSIDILASEPESLEKAVEACMTMTGRATDKFVNLRTKTRDLLKMWTGSAGQPRREKVALKILQDVGQVDALGMRTKGKAVTFAHSQAQVDCANRFYEAHIKKKREQVFETVDLRFAGGLGFAGGR
ncbi:kinase-like protein [Linnemannia elongata AG-77]|uniref:Kinase-like protein n=1 Tax=Linnemannia elongata AG-77 TaxID=1314771 RepID=A0A197JS21_9FUNG|nr:kinase-like protein [Linnemannia elongata AG-77]